MKGLVSVDNERFNDCTSNQYSRQKLLDKDYKQSLYIDLRSHFYLSQSSDRVI